MIFRIIDVYANILAKLMVLLMYVLLFAVTLQVLGRYVPFIPRYLWPLEVTNFSLIWLIFVGSVLGIHEKKHFYVDLFPDCSPAMEKFLKILYYVVVYTVCAIFVVFGYRYFVKWGLIQISDLTGMNLGFVYVTVPFAGISWTLFLTADLYKELFISSEPSEHPQG